VNEISPRTPVIVGVGVHQERLDDPAQSSEAYRLMVQAARNAAADAGTDDLLTRMESISIPQGLWPYRNPGKLVGDALGCGGAKTIVTDLGVLQLLPLAELCQAIATGAQDVGLVTGGEAKYRDLRSQITGQSAPVTEQGEDTPRPDLRRGSSDPFCSDLESKRGLQSPISLFAIIESALRYARGLSIDAHRDAVARMYSEFSRVAAANPQAWSREVVRPEEIRDPTPKNPMQSFPYTKRHCSNWNVNRAVAILVCSVEMAEKLAIDRRKWIFPLSTVESRHVVVLAQQRKLHSHLGTVLSGKRAFELADASPADVTAAELYSCFPAAVGSFAHDLALPQSCPLTVTGSMAFSGGPFNHFTLDGVARMVEVLRAEAAESPESRRLGLVTNLSGIFGKQACALFSNAPNAGGYRYEDITATVAAADPPCPLDDDYVGPAMVVGYTVVFQRGQPSHGVAICDTPKGARTVARSDDPALLERIMTRELCGREVKIASDGSFTEP
jgi:acetyl-CoA C-acetyltransferase